MKRIQLLTYGFEFCKSSNGSDGDDWEKKTSHKCSNDLPYWQIHIIQASGIAKIHQRSHIFTSSKFSLCTLLGLQLAYKISSMSSFIFHAQTDRLFAEESSSLPIVIGHINLALAIYLISYIDVSMVIRIENMSLRR